MSGVEARIGVRVQDFRAGYPSLEERSDSLPTFACPLTAACECLVPQSIDPLTEGAQLSEVARHCVVLVVAIDDSAEPGTGFGRAIMHATTKLDLESYSQQGQTVSSSRGLTNAVAGLQF